MEKNSRLPDVVIGTNSKTGDSVIIPAQYRTLSTMIVGSHGTSAFALPLIEQDLNHMNNFIQDNSISKSSPGDYLNGISIIEPSNDICQRTLQLVRAHGISDEAVTYIDPLDPNTPNINPMRGPVEKVAEVMVQILAEINNPKDGMDFFFEQGNRNHLKNYIYLLKLHDTEKEVTLDMLLEMYNNPQLVRAMHVALKMKIPVDIEQIENRDERNHWKIIQGIDSWFESNLLPKKIFQGTIQFPDYGENGEMIYYDAQAEHVQGVRNALNDMGSNILIRRVLFGTSDFDFERHMEVGGVLLVNTAKNDIGELSNIIGKIVLMNLQNASFKRIPSESSYHHILVDKANNYLYRSFEELVAQSRKYKVIITTLHQSLQPLGEEFGQDFLNVLLGNMRNRIMYKEITSEDILIQNTFEWIANIIVDLKPMPVIHLNPIRQVEYG